MNTYAKYSKIPKLFYLALLFLVMKYETGQHLANDLLKAQLNVLNSRNLSENHVINENIRNNSKYLRTVSRLDENGNPMKINDIMMAMFFSDDDNYSDFTQSSDIPNDSDTSDESDLDNKDNKNNKYNKDSKDNKYNKDNKDNQATNILGDDMNNYLYSYTNGDASYNPSTSHSNNTELSNENTPSTSSFNRNNDQGIKFNSQQVANNEGAKRKCLDAYKKVNNRPKKQGEETKQEEGKKHVEKKKHLEKTKNDKSSDNLEITEYFEWNQSEEEISSKIAGCNKAKEALMAWESDTIRKLHNNPSLSNRLCAINTIKEIEENHFKVMMLEELNNCILLGKINGIPKAFIKEKWTFAYSRMRQEINDQFHKIFDDLRSYTKKSNANVKDLLFDIKMAKNKCMKLRGIIHKHNQNYFMESIKKFLKDNKSYNNFNF
ncbi:Plasmodium exported protein, unknown function [Plasmodium chabaudi chabaudi]|uniref:Plasmodium RESA N-terminal domain-containing protein n=1 Tax=Plasmodium chabaudi chabaudi TaxID=31271 RepID=A0A1C6YLB9_PLACU|nr:Plasmodium exported protein, unknown function [Plasmodium chabaudi chabaudi]